MELEESIDIGNIDSNKLHMLTNMQILYPRMQYALSKIKFCHEFSKTQINPECLCMHGITGVGKTYIKDVYTNGFASELSNNGLVKRVFTTIVPEEPTKKSLATQILSDLGDMNASKGYNKTDITIRVVRLIRECKVELMFLDEAHHFIDSKYESVGSVADWFKNLITASRVCIVLLGLPKCLGLFSANEQLGRRFSNRYALTPFKWNTDDEKLEFRFLLQSIDKLLPFEQRSELNSADISGRIYFATLGVMDYVIKLIMYAGVLALSKKEATITRNTLEVAFQDKLWGLRPNLQENPFTPQTFNIDLAYQIELLRAKEETLREEDKPKDKTRRGKKKRESSKLF